MGVTIDLSLDVSDTVISISWYFLSKTQAIKQYR
jgi:hypothetical protein